MANTQGEHGNIRESLSHVNYKMVGISLGCLVVVEGHHPWGEVNLLVASCNDVCYMDTIVAFIKHHESVQCQLQGQASHN